LAAKKGTKKTENMPPLLSLYFLPSSQLIIESNLFNELGFTKGPTICHH